MDANREHNSFFHFSHQLRLEATEFSNLSIGETIWTTAMPSDLVTNGWKTSFVTNQKLAFGSAGSKRYNNDYSESRNLGDKFVNFKNYGGNDINDKFSNLSVGGIKNYDGNGKYFGLMNYGDVNNNYFDKAIGKPVNGGGSVMKINNFGNELNGKNKNFVNGFNNYNHNYNYAMEKKHKTLPASEALPRDEAIGGYIFVCNNDTMDENLRRELFGLPPRYRESVQAITPGLPIFLYNYSTHQLHGVFEAASFGGTNIDPTAWEDKKCPGSSRFPSQVRVVTRKICNPLDEDAFRPILHHYDGPKFRLELNIEETLKLLEVFAEKIV